MAQSLGLAPTSNSRHSSREPGVAAADRLPTSQLPARSGRQIVLERNRVLPPAGPAVRLSLLQCRLSSSVEGRRRLRDECRRSQGNPDQIRTTLSWTSTVD